MSCSESQLKIVAVFLLEMYGESLLSIKFGANQNLL